MTNCHFSDIEDLSFHPTLKKARFWLQRNRSWTRLAKLCRTPNDQPINRQLAVFMIERLGHWADPAANGKEAVDACSTIPYALILIECQMPERRHRESNPSPFVSHFFPQAFCLTRHQFQIIHTVKNKLPKTEKMEMDWIPLTGNSVKMMFLFIWERHVSENLACQLTSQSNH